MGEEHTEDEIKRNIVNFSYEEFYYEGTYFGGALESSIKKLRPIKRN